jgi:hypothetical protein
MPVFLLAVFSKGERSNLSHAECNQLKKLTKAITEGYGVRVPAR